MDQVKLDQLKFFFESQLTHEFIDEHIHVMQDYYRDVVRVRFAARILGRKEGPHVIRFPASWWQHFKQAMFPAFLLRRFPVRHTVVEVDAFALYPELTKQVAGESPHISYEDRWIYGGDEE